MKSELNEGVFRSPKWLRNFVDFEVNTGDDIKGEPSKKRKRKEDIERWDDRWDEIDEDKFKEFFRKEYTTEFIKKYNAYITDSDMDKIYISYRGDFTILDKYDLFIKKEEDERKRQDAINKEINDIIDNMIRDHSRNPWTDKFKFSTNSYSGKTIVEYEFENGEKFKLDDDKLNYGRFTYTLSTAVKIRFVSTVNILIGKSKRRPGKSWDSTSGSQSGYERKSQGDQKARSTSGPKRSTGHPKEALYNTLKETIKQRQDQLKKLSANDPNRKALENELFAAESRLKEMKSKYQFENIKSFDSWKPI